MTPPCVICGQPAKAPRRPSETPETCGTKSCVQTLRVQRQREGIARGDAPKAFTWDETPYDPFTYMQF